MLGAFSPFSEGLSYGRRPPTIATSMTMMVRWSSWSRHILSSYHSVYTFVLESDMLLVEVCSGFDSVSTVRSIEEHRMHQHDIGVS